MDNNNYNMKQQTVSEYVKNNSQSDRQKHIDLTTPCIPSVIKINTASKKAGDYTSSTHGTKSAMISLKEFLQLSGSTNYKIHTCHRCDNSSSAPNGFVCTNPKHIYFGTVSENNNDLDQNGKPTGSKKSGPENIKKVIANGNHMNQQTLTCPHCNKNGNPGNMKRWHFSNCKFNK